MDPSDNSSHRTRTKDSYKQCLTDLPYVSMYLSIYIYIYNHRGQADLLDFSEQNMSFCKRVKFLELNLISHLPAFFLGIEKTSPSGWGESDYFEIFPSPFPPCLLFLFWITTPLPTQPLHLNAIDKLFHDQINSDINIMNKLHNIIPNDFCIIEVE